MYQGDQDSGDILVEDGFVVMTRSFETMAYLCLFGGNEDDDGSDATKNFQWWGNEGELEERQYRGQFQALLKGAPVTSQTRIDLGNAALADLEDVFVGGGYASAVDLDIEMPSNKRVELAISIKLTDGRELPLRVSGELA